MSDRKRTGFVWKAAAAGAAFAVSQAVSLCRFRVTRHKFRTAKVSSMIRIVSLSDLHDHTYGPVNRELLDSVQALRPDIIVIPGDFFTMHKKAKNRGIPEESVRTLLFLAKIAPVYYVFGNHESRILAADHPQKEPLLQALGTARLAGIHILRNERAALTIGADHLEISGFEPDTAYYCKGARIGLREGYLEEKLGSMRDPSAVQILLAHNPAFFEAYARTQAELVFSGHTHGGLVRIPGIGSVVSPEFTLFPKYDRPEVTSDGTTMYVSRGLGTHTVHLRVFDPAEIVTVDLMPLEDLK